jgi:hypothetical protein
MRHPQRTDVVLERELRDELDRLAAELGHARLAQRLGLGQAAVLRARAGAPVLRATAIAIRAGLDLLTDGAARHQLAPSTGRG